MMTQEAEKSLRDDLRALREKRDTTPAQDGHIKRLLKALRPKEETK